MAAISLKFCSTCKKRKPLEHFFNDKIKQDGKASTCKICSSARVRGWKEKNSFPAKMDGTKTCRTCKFEKDISEFYRNNKAKDGRTSVCADCTKARSNQWSRENQYDKARSARYKYRYGITLDEYYELLTQQNFTCANISCENKADEEIYGALMVDHNHECCSNGKGCGRCVRGLLCSRCNKVLGMMKDNIETMNGLVNYLKDHEDKK